MQGFPKSDLSISNYRKAVGTEKKFTNVFTKIADKNMPKYAIICKEK